jgi:hypothetical protein
MSYTEEQFAGQIEDLLKIYGWRWCHFRPARTEKGWRTAITGDKGFPDYIAARPPRLIIAEIKSEKGAITPEQGYWLWDLQKCQRDDTSPLPAIPEIYLWRPSDIESIKEILK